VAFVDRLGRSLGNLRLSVTDRCNLRCAYCMPEQEYVWLPKRDILSFEEISALSDVFLDLGVQKVRITGGEPLQRVELPVLIRMLAQKSRIADLSLTSNGVTLGESARPLREAGLHRLTISLDTLRPERFLALSGRPYHAQVLRGIRAAMDAGFAPLKLDSVILRGQNEDELGDLLAFARELGAELRFIEYMDVGGATRWAPERVFSRDAMLAALTAIHGPIEPLPGRGSAPRRALPPRRWNGVRHHRLHHRSLLSRLRSRPPHRGRHLVSMPLCPARHRFTGAPALRRIPRVHRGGHHPRLGGPQ
jgi:cyclic pyranopterin phosphate synthase